MAHHHSHHQPQGPPPTHHLQQSRPPSIVHGHHPQSHNPNPYAPGHNSTQYAQGASGAGGHNPQELPYYNQTHASPYSTPGASTYSSAAEGTPDIMASAHIQSRPYPPIYHTPQSNSPASIASPSGHDQQQRMYGGTTSQMQPNPQMYGYPGQQSQYPIPPQAAPQYAPHPQQPHHQPHHQQSMTSQPNLLMSQTPAQHMQPHPSQHAQGGMIGSPRTKMESQVPQITRPVVVGPPQHQQQQQQQPQQQQQQQQQQQPPQHQANGPPMNQNNVPGTGGGGVNPNAAPGPIPATTPLVVRQDNNGVQWIAFEYSRDRVKMEYTIRCDVESVTVDSLTPEFKTENCVYPRACCSKDQYRGNRLVYENECNTVGWALADLNPCLRGKRGLIQRAVDSWRNSNQDPRLRSRRVRRMAKINNRKAVQSSATQPPHMPGPGVPAGMPPSQHMGGPGGAGSMGKPSIGGMGGGSHHHQMQNGSAGGEDVDDEYMDESSHTHHHNQPAAGAAGSQQDDVREAHNFQGYSSASNYPPPPGSSSGPSQAPLMHGGPHPSHAIASRPQNSTSSHHKSSSGPAEMSESERLDLFGDIPEAKKRKFILVDDPGKGQRIRVRVTLDTVDTDEIPDSFRKSNSVYPRSWFPIQMQDPPPSAGGSNFWIKSDWNDVDGGDEVDAGNGGGRRRKMKCTVPLPSGEDGEVETPVMRKSVRSKEVKLNDLGYRMTWHQSRVFADKTVFLQKALDSYRNKVRTTMEAAGRDVAAAAPHFETRVGKRAWNDRGKRERERGSEE